MKKLIVLDYIKGECHSYNITPPEGSMEKYNQFIDDKIQAFGHDLDNISYMITEDDIIIH
jgi:hypothetical protein